MKTKNEICVPIRDEKELQQAKEILERNGEKIDEILFRLSNNERFNYLHFNAKCNDWELYYKLDRTEIPLSELESVLRGESESKKQSSIEWLLSLLKTDEEKEIARKMHREETVDSYTNGMYKGQEIYFSDTKIKLDVNSVNYCIGLSDEYYNETFKND